MSVVLVSSTQNAHYWIDGCICCVSHGNSHTLLSPFHLVSVIPGSCDSLWERKENRCWSQTCVQILALPSTMHITLARSLQQIWTTVSGNNCYVVGLF